MPWLAYPWVPAQPCETHLLWSNYTRDTAFVYAKILLDAHHPDFCGEMSSATLSLTSTRCLTPTLQLMDKGRKLSISLDSSSSSLTQSKLNDKSVHQGTGSSPGIGINEPLFTCIPTGNLNCRSTHTTSRTLSFPPQVPLNRSFSTTNTSRLKLQSHPISDSLITTPSGMSSCNSLLLEQWPKLAQPAAWTPELRASKTGPLRFAAGTICWSDNPMWCHVSYKCVMYGTTFMCLRFPC